eukprot:6491989-Amphidinium_carterae.3
MSVMDDGRKRRFEVVRSAAKRQRREATPLNCIQPGQRCVVKGIVSFVSMPHATQAGSPKQVVELHDASTVSTDPVRVTVMGQHNMRLLEEATFGACIQLDAPMCSEYQGVLSLMVGPKDTMSLQLLPNDEKLELPSLFFWRSDLQVHQLPD